MRPWLMILLALASPALAGEGQTKPTPTPIVGPPTPFSDMMLDVQRLQARIDASDVVQEAYFGAVGRLEEYLKNPRYPLFLRQDLERDNPMARLRNIDFRIAPEGIC